MFTLIKGEKEPTNKIKNLLDIEIIRLRLE